MTMTRDKIEELKRLYAAMTNCEMYGEDGAAKGVMVPQSLLNQFEAALADRALEPQGQALCHVRYRCSQRWDGNGNNDPQIYEGWEVCEAHERGDDGSDAIPVFAPCAALLPEPPTLPQSLLNLIGDYGMARTDGCTEFGVISRWSGVIDGIKQYARAYASQLALPAGPVPEGWKDAIEAVRTRMENDTPSAYDNSGYREYAGVILDAVEDQLAALASPSPAVAQPVAVIRFERGTPGKENDMPRVISCNWLPDGEYQVFLSATGVAQPVADDELPYPAFVKGCYDYYSAEQMREHGRKERQQALAEADIIHKGLLATFCQPVADERDTQRLDFMTEYQASVVRSRDGDVFSVWHRDEDGEWEPMLGYPLKCFDSPREAIDAARAALCQPAEEGGKS